MIETSTSEVGMLQATKSTFVEIDTNSELSWKYVQLTPHHRAERQQQRDFGRKMKLFKC